MNYSNVALLKEILIIIFSLIWLDSGIFRILIFREPEKEYLDNNLKHIENISSLIYTYMLSPKEAFRIVNIYIYYF